MDWIYQNIGNLIVGILVLISVSCAIIKIQKTGKKSGCTNGCSGCPYSSACGKQR